MSDGQFLDSPHMGEVSDIIDKFGEQVGRISVVYEQLKSEVDAGNGDKGSLDMLAAINNLAGRMLEYSRGVFVAFTDPQIGSRI